jgi:hypothetical protein
LAEPGGQRKADVFWFVAVSLSVLAEPGPRKADVLGVSGVVYNNGEEYSEGPEHFYFVGVLCSRGEWAFEELVHLP